LISESHYHLQAYKHEVKWRRYIHFYIWWAY